VNFRSSVPSLVVLTVIPRLLLAQDFDERSVSEPTRLSGVALDSGAETRVVGTQALVESRESIAQIAAVLVLSSDGEHHRGVRVSLKNSSQADQLYIDVGEAAQLRDEFGSFDKWHERTPTCEAINLCVEGVARCRPSQSLRQAYCPSAYSTSRGERGVLLSTPRHSFRFPSTEPSAFVHAIDVAIAELARRETSDSEH
jgi:hypothetical protein